MRDLKSPTNAGLSNGRQFPPTRKSSQLRSSKLRIHTQCLNFSALNEVDLSFAEGCLNDGMMRSITRAGSRPHLPVAHFPNLAGTDTPTANFETLLVTT